MDDDINRTLGHVRKFLMVTALKPLPPGERDDVANDILLDLFRYDWPNHDPDLSPLEPYLINAAKREARRRIGPTIQKRIRTREAETAAARERERADSRASTPMIDVDEDLPDIPLNRGYHRVLWELLKAHPGEPLYKLGRLAGYTDKGNISRAVKAIRQKIEAATSATDN